MAVSHLSSFSSLSNLLPRRPSVLLRPFSSAASDDQTLITIETSVPFTAHNCDPPSRSVSTTPSELLSFFRPMLTMRRMEIAADSLYKAKLIRGFCHLYDGQETVTIGMEAAIMRKDAIITAYQDHCIFLARGGTLDSTFAELMGRRSGCSKGKGGSMHFYKKDAGSTAGMGLSGRRCPSGVGSLSGRSTPKRGRSLSQCRGLGREPEAAV